MGTAFSPLDEALELPGAALLPHAHQSLLRLATVMPFDQAARALDALLGLQISVSTVRRQTLQAGRIMEAIQAEQAQPQQGRPRFPLRAQEPPSRLAKGSDGGMVPLRGGQWAEVKTLVIGEVLASSAEQKQTRSHSYFSRLCDAQTFADLASAEIARRGVAQAQQVCAIQDGAEWLQGFVDGHRADALRILDFAHAAGYLGQVAEQGRLAGYHVPASWLAIVLHELKHHGPDRLLKHLAWWQAHRPSAGVTDALRYLGKRRAQLDYPRFREQGWPLGSGMVESANKLLMQARLKGAGMHWQQGNVNPMLALRGALCNERWDESWQDHQRWRQDDRHAKRRERSARLRARLICHLKEQIVRIALLLPSSILAGPPTAPKGRTQAQQRWGRQTFSSRRLREQALAKI